MKLRYKISALVLVLLGVFLYGRYGNKKGSPGLIAKLPVEDTEQILINPVSHKITVITHNGTTTTTLPDHVSTIDVHKDGTTKVTAAQFGLEARPFGILTYSDGLRYGAGLDGGFYKKLDIGIGLAGGSGLVPIAFAKLSYNVYDNLQIGIVYDHRQHIGGCITIRI